MYIYHIRGPPTSPQIVLYQQKTIGERFFAAPLSLNAGPWQSGLLRPTYNRGERVHARSEGPNPSGPA